MESVRLDGPRTGVALVALAGFLSAQWLMPGLIMIQSVSAAEQARVPKSVPKPAWAVARDKREAPLKAAQEARLKHPMLLAQVPDSALVPPGGNFQVWDEGPGSKPGKIVPSEPTGCGPGGDCEVEMTALDLSRVPTEKELRKAGQLGGALSPTGDAEPTSIARKVDQELKKAGIPKGLSDSAPPTSAAGQLIQAGKYKVQRARDINLSFGRAIQEWNKHNYPNAAKMFEKHVKDFPESPWVGEANLHLGCDAKYNGRFSEAQEFFDGLLQTTSSDPSKPEFEIHQKAKLRWADLDLALGRWKDAVFKLTNIIATDSDWRRVTWARHWMRNAHSFDRAGGQMLACGSEALSFMFASMNQKTAAARVALLKPKGEEGFSLADLEKMARDNGVPMRGFKASDPKALAKLPLPMIVHYDFGVDGKFASAKTVSQGKNKDAVAKVMAATEKKDFHTSHRAGHFLVVQKVDSKKGQVALFDPLQKRHYYLSYKQFAREWSGKGLMLARGARVASAPSTSQHTANAQPLRVALLTNTEMRQTVGGCCGVPSPEDDDCGNYDGPGSGGGSGGGGGRGGGGCGGPAGGGIAPDDTRAVLADPNNSNASPIWMVNKVNLNLRVEDTPLWYSTPKGPDVEIMMTYNSNDGTTQNNPFGNKWMFNYGSYAVEDTGYNGGRVTVFMPNGSKLNYTPNGSGGYVPSEPGDNNILRKLSPTRYELEFEGGDKAIYDIPAGTASLQPFLVELRDRWGFSLHFGYNAQVRLTTITDAANKVTRLQHDTLGRIRVVWDPFGRHASFNYDAYGNMVEAIDMEGHAFQYTYDSTIRLTRLNTAQGPWKFKHEGPDGNSGCYDCYPTPDGPTWQNIRMTITDPANKKEEYFYNGGYTNGGAEINDPQIGEFLSAGESWHVSKTAYVDYSSTRNNASPAVPKTRWITPPGGYSGYPGSSGGSNAGNPRVRRMLYPNGDNEYYTYDASNGLPNTIKNQNNKTATLTYNVKGQPLTIVDRKNQTTSFTYAPNGLDVTSITNAKNKVIASYTYDAFHQPLSMTDGSTVTTTMTYTAWGAPATLTRAGKTTTYHYDTLGRLSSLTRGTNTLAGYTYDEKNRLKTQTSASGLTVGYEYNNIDKLTRIVFPDTTDIKYEYVCCGLVGAMKDRANRWTFYDYDEMKRLTRVQDASARVIYLGYDANGNRTHLQDSRGGYTRWEYDPNDRLIKKVYDNNTYESYTYGANGALATRRNARGQVINYGYDDNDNLLLVDYPTMADVSFTYTELDKPLTMTDGLGTSTFGYDDLARLTSVDGPFTNDTVNYSYNAMGHKQSLGLNGSQAVSYTYDALDRLQTISSSAGSFNYAYLGNTGQVSQISLPNNTRTNFAYNGLSQLEAIENTKGSGLTSSRISRYGYGYDARGVRTYSDQQVSSSAVQRVNYTYDLVDQLTLEAAVPDAGGNTYSNGFSFDAMGNRLTSTSSSSSGGTSTSSENSYASNRLNQLVSLTSSTAGGATTSTLSYDEDGNLRHVGATLTSGTFYDYDDNDRLRAVTTRTASGTNSGKSEFLYDGMDRLRISRTFAWQNNTWVQNGEVRRVYDGMDVVQERDAQNNALAFYTRSGNIGGILARTSAQGNLFYHYDGSGNVSQLTDSSGATVGAYKYDAFGNTLSATGTAASAQPYRYSTKEQLAGMLSYGYRFYIPSLGRWINRDPVAEKGGLNLYGMVFNNPTNLVDLDGRFPPAVGAVLLIQGARALISCLAGAGIGAAAEIVSQLLANKYFCAPFDPLNVGIKALIGCIGGLTGPVGTGVIIISIIDTGNNLRVGSNNDTCPVDAPGSNQPIVLPRPRPVPPTPAPPGLPPNIPDSGYREDPFAQR
jgi:RHS repeat-associated protein